ncbi:MAG: thioredoxin domain-containing protein [Actinomycetota bacterium]
MSPNRLADQTSPYLLQHKDNPVDWFPWGDEASSKARAEDKPLLISIGYAACHWCHVMERESFEDEQTAAIMNSRFVSIKVDREERPDVDAVYMAATQALTGHGGWPMTVFATADGVPFIAGTYFPPEPRHGMPSFKEVLTHVSMLWETRRDDLLQQGTRLVDAIARSTPPASNDPLEAGLLTSATSQIMANHDREHGGFGAAPKFPQAPVLEFLLRMHPRPGVRDALELTLRKMALGGMYDQIGGGFARYSVDATWTIPHFEKMLYDNAQLTRVYTHAWQLWKDPLYERIVVETLDYLLRDMRDEAGGFHSSEDADSEGEEGKFYVWSLDEFRDIAPEVTEYYGITQHGNFEGANNPVANGEVPPADARRKLFERREQRIRPGKDDKVLASWNGLAIAAFAEAGAAFNRTDLIDAAREAATFVTERMSDGHAQRGGSGGRSAPGQMSNDDGLLHSYRAGTVQIAGLLEDYAFMADGLLALWEATFEKRWLDLAISYARTAVELFNDPRDGGFYTTTENLVVRHKEVVESATPAPGAVLALVLQRIAHLTDERETAKPAVDALRVARIYMERAAQAVPTWLSALDFYLATPKEIAFTGPLDDELLRTVHTRFLPNRVMAAGEVDGLPLLNDKPATEASVAYVCERFVCKQPTSDPQELAAQLD